MLEWQKLRAQRAALIGLTYEASPPVRLRTERASGAIRGKKAMRPTAEWRVLEILERGRYLNASDTTRIAEIVAKRGVRY